MTKVVSFAQSIVLVAVVLGLSFSSVAQAGFSRSSAVGGIEIDPNGVLSNMTTAGTQKLAELRRQALEPVPQDLSESSDFRKISLRRLMKTVEESVRNGRPLPDEVLYMAGLQRIQYVFVYPEEQDIIIAGPAEGWTLNREGVVVGETTGQPVLQLDDFLQALRIATEAPRSSITCSIDPTQDGVARLNQFVAQQGGRINNLSAQLNGIKQALGSQVITLKNVPESSRMARILVAADYRMKRIAMGFEPSPVRGMKSFLDMSTGTSANMFPRWWLAMNSDPLSRSEAGDAWEFKGCSVKAMTEDTYFAENGQRQSTGRVNPAAQTWAESMTNNYDAMAQKMTIFAELRNIMDLTVVATLLVKERMAQKAGLDMGAFLDGSINLAEFTAPKTIPTQVSYVKKRGRVIISATGGVEIGAWDVASQYNKSDDLDPLRMEAEPEAMVWQWWWD
ncbi:Hypothetical protein PBC10988_7350 [Planctomycetales bacterium 10988]|nr:Hypothetical protein PBC10988_7350 [Planctomycetales bacterium 10988]